MLRNTTGTTTVRTTIDGEVAFTYELAVIMSVCFGGSAQLKENAFHGNRKRRVVFVADFGATFGIKLSDLTDFSSFRNLPNPFNAAVFHFTHYLHHAFHILQLNS